MPKMPDPTLEGPNLHANPTLLAEPTDTGCIRKIRH